MHRIFVSPRDPAAVAIRCVTPATWPDVCAGLDAPMRAFAEAAGFEPRAGRHLMLPAPDGALAGVLYGVDADDHPARDPFWAGALPGVLPSGTFRLDDPPGDARVAALAFVPGGYRFARYRKRDDQEIRPEPPAGADGEDLSPMLDARSLPPVLIHTPTNDIPGRARGGAPARRTARRRRPRDRRRRLAGAEFSAGPWARAAAKAPRRSI